MAPFGQAVGAGTVGRPMGLMSVIASRQFITRLRESRENRQRTTAYEPTYRLPPRQRVNTNHIYETIQKTTDKHLQGFVYDPETARRTSVLLTDLVQTQVKKTEAIRNKRYRVVVSVSIGEVRGQGLSIASRFVWSESVDNCVSYQYENPKFFCLVNVFLVYKE